MELETKFYVPDFIVGGLRSGNMVRNGGVIQWAKGTVHAGETIAWLREFSPTPIKPDSVIQFMGSDVANTLAFFGNISSILNLGATVGFGISTTRKLNRVEKKVDRLQESSDRIEAKADSIMHNLQEVAWTVEWGFYTTLHQIDNVQEFLELELLSKLKHVAYISCTAQKLEPGSHQRITRLENALSESSKVTEQLILLVEKECSYVDNKLIGGAIDRLEHIDECINALRRVRQGTIAVHLTAMIMAETGQPDEAARFYQDRSERLWSAARKIVYTFFKNDGPGYCMFPIILRNTTPDQISTLRIGRWLAAFDPEFPRSPEKAAGKLLDFLRSKEPSPKIYSPYKFNADTIEGKVSLEKRIMLLERASYNIAIDKHFEGKVIVDNSSPFYVFFDNKKWHLEKILAFANLVDGVIEDRDRQLGTIQELLYCVKAGLSWQEYRDMLKVEAPKKDSLLAILIPKRIPHNKKSWDYTVKPKK